MMTKEKLVEFTPPEGTIDPEVTEGEAMVRWQKKPDGRYCIVEFEGAAMPGYGGEEETTETVTEENPGPAIEDYVQ